MKLLEYRFCPDANTKEGLELSQSHSVGDFYPLSTSAVKDQT